MNTNFTCTANWIFTDVPHQIWEALAADPPTWIFLSRFLHNKPLFYFNNYIRCYLSYLSPDFITTAFTVVGLILFIIGLWFLIKKKKWFLLAILLIGPMFPLLGFFSVGLYICEGVVIIYGLKSLLRR